MTNRAGFASPGFPDSTDGAMGIRDLFDANAEILLDEDNGFSEEWSYTPPATSEVPDPESTTGNWIFDEDDAGEGRQLEDQGEEIVERGLLDLPASIAIDTKGIFTRTLDGSVWRIDGVPSRDRDLQTVRLLRTTVLSTRKSRRRGP